MESMMQKILRIIISNIFGVIVFWFVIDFGLNLGNEALSNWELPLAMLVVYLVVLDIRIITNKA